MNKLSFNIVVAGNYHPKFFNFFKTNKKKKKLTRTRRTHKDESESINTWQ